jgi:ribose transport system substrate-binding protein
MKTFYIVGSIALILIITTFGCSGQVEKSEKTTEESKTVSTAAPILIPNGGHVEAVERTSEKNFRIAVLAFQNRSPFWYSVRDGVDAAQEYLKHYHTSVDYIVMGNEITRENVISAIEKAINEKYDAIAVPPFFNGTASTVNKAVNAGITVITYNAAGEEDSARLAFIGQDAYKAGRFAGQKIEEITNGKGKIGIINGYSGAVQHEDRIKGAVDYLKENTPHVDIVGIYENEDKAEKAYLLTRKMLKEHPDLKVIYVTAGGPFGAAKAIKDLGLTGKVHVIGYDLIPENIKYVQSGEIAAVIGQDPFGQAFDAAVYLHNYLAAGILPEKQFIAVEMTVVTPENVHTLLLEQ